MSLTSSRDILSQFNIEKYGPDFPAWWHDNITDDAIARIELVQAKRIVTLSVEYSTDCIVDFEGHELFAEQLPISASLIERIRKWTRLLDVLDQEQQLADGPINWNPFVQEGYHIAVAIKRKLPDWTVNYADEFKTYLAPGGYFCPEVMADGSLGPCTVEHKKGRIAVDMWNTFLP